VGADGASFADMASISADNAFERQPKKSGSKNISDRFFFKVNRTLITPLR